MSTLQVFDPSMCCSTGICGPEVDERLVRFAADLDWLASKGITVTRTNLSQEPTVFAADPEAKSVLEERGEAGLPLIKVDGKVVSTGIFPSREELAGWAGIALPAQSLFTAAVAELVAIGAAVASNCEACFKFHYDKALKLGVSREDMWSAVTLAQQVKEAPAKAVYDVAQRYLHEEQPAEKTKTEAGSCCSPKAESAPVTKTSCC